MAEQWNEKDTLRQMTSKFNGAVDDLEGLKKSSAQVNQATEKRFTEMDKKVSKKFQEVNEELTKKVSSVSAEDIGLGSVDNTSDSEKPVSIAQQEAIDSAKADILETVETKITSEEADSSEILGNGDNPEVSNPIKEYINDRIQEIASQGGVTPVSTATTTVAGVIRASEDIEVDSRTGKATIPKLAELSEHVTSSLNAVSEALEQTNNASVKAVKLVGNLDALATENKTSLVAAVNEVFQLGNKTKTKLVDILVAKGKSCSTSDSWDTLLGYVENLN